VRCVGTHAQVKNIGILRSLNDEAGAGTKILTASSSKSRITIINRASAPLLHNFEESFVLARQFNAICSLENAPT
jgi:hypothetical protein